jgi:hypothetical protein
MVILETENNSQCVLRVISVKKTLSTEVHLPLSENSHIQINIKGKRRKKKNNETWFTPFLTLRKHFCMQFPDENLPQFQSAH